jgi:type II secretion system protein N
MIKGIFAYKREILLTLLCFVFFLFVLFPVEDLSDLVTEQVAKNTQNQVFLNFKSIGIDLLPLGVTLKSVSVDTPVAPGIKMASLSLAPSLTGLLTFRPGFVARAEGLFGGSLKLAMKGGKKDDAGSRPQNVDLQVEDINLRQLTSFIEAPVEVLGSGSLAWDGEIDPSFRKQPVAEYVLEIKSLKLPAGSAPTMLGPINYPTIEIRGLRLKGRLVNGELIIEDSSIGQAGDSLSGRIKGKMQMALNPQGGQVRPQFGAYDLKLDLTLNKEIEAQLGIFLSLLDKFKTPTGTGSRYAVQLIGSNFYAPPRTQSYSSF